MHDGTAETRMFGSVLIVDVKRIVVTGDLRERLDVFFRNHARPFVGVTDFDRFVRVSHENRIVADMHIVKRRVGPLLKVRKK